MSHRWILFAAVLLLSHPSNGAAQEPVPVPVGSRVRLTYGASPRTVLVGTLVRLQPESLGVLVKKGRQEEAIRRADVERVEVSVRKPDIARGLGLGAVGGVLTAGVTWLVVSAATGECGQAQATGFFCHGGGSSNLVKVLAAGVAMGAAAGVEIALTNPRDRWSLGRLNDLAPLRSASPAALELGFGQLSSHAVLSLGLRLRL